MAIHPLQMLISARFLALGVCKQYRIWQNLPLQETQHHCRAVHSAAKCHGQHSQDRGTPEPETVNVDSFLLGMVRDKYEYGPSYSHHPRTRDFGRVLADLRRGSLERES